MAKRGQRLATSRADRIRQEARPVHSRMSWLLLRFAELKGNPMYKPWHIATSNFRLADNLNKCRCQHAPGFHHDHAKGSETPKTAFYPEAMARTISECLYPEHVYAMPVIASPSNMPRSSVRTGSKKVLGMAAKSVKRSSHEPNIQDKNSIYAGIHLLLDRKDWHKHQGWKEAIDKELNVILENGTWN